MLVLKTSLCFVRERYRALAGCEACVCTDVPVYAMPSLSSTTLVQSCDGMGSEGELCLCLGICLRFVLFTFFLLCLRFRFGRRARACERVCSSGSFHCCYDKMGIATMQNCTEHTMRILLLNSKRIEPLFSAKIYIRSHRRSVKSCG